MQAENVWYLGVKELRSLSRDRVLIALIVLNFTVAVYGGATASSEVLNKAAIAVVDEDRSPLSVPSVAAFQTPYFQPPVLITQTEMDRRMDAGLDTFAVVIPPDFQRDVLAKRSPAVQLNVDATRVSQALIGSGYIQRIVGVEVQAFAQRYQSNPVPLVDLAERARFNPALNKTWFGGVNKVIEAVTMLALVLTGAALLRERERGTIEHLLVMPVTPFEIMTSKVWAMGAVVFAASALSLIIVVRGLLAVPLAGSIPLFFCGTALHLFATTALGLFLATFTKSMSQFGLLLMMVWLPLQMLSGSVTARESMPAAIQWVMLAAPNTHFVRIAQGILFRGAGLSVVWPQSLALTAIGSVLFGVPLSRFRKTIGTMA